VHTRLFATVILLFFLFYHNLEMGKVFQTMCIFQLIFSMQQHMYRICLARYMLSPFRLSDGCIIQRRLTLGLWNFHHTVAPCLADDIHLVFEGHRRRLRSSTDRSCAVPHTHNTFRDRSFAIVGPRVWNSLPAHLHDEDITYGSFRRELNKTFCFNVASGACHRGLLMLKWGLLWLPGSGRLDEVQ